MKQRGFPQPAAPVNYQRYLSRFSLITMGGWAVFAIWLVGSSREVPLLLFGIQLAIIAVGLLILRALGRKYALLGHALVWLLGALMFMVTIPMYGPIEPIIVFYILFLPAAALLLLVLLSLASSYQPTPDGR